MRISVKHENASILDINKIDRIGLSVKLSEEKIPSFDAKINLSELFK